MNGGSFTNLDTSHLVQSEPAVETGHYIVCMQSDAFKGNYKNSFK